MTSESLGYDEAALLEELKGWWDEQLSEDDPFAEPKPPSGTIFDVLPAIDSLGMVSGLVAVEKHVPFKVPVRVIRRGGYNSFKDLESDLMPKLRTLAERHKARQAERAAKPGARKKEAA
jgi:acyl carrier protein